MLSHRRGRSCRRRLSLPSRRKGSRETLEITDVFVVRLIDGLLLQADPSTHGDRLAISIDAQVPLDSRSIGSMQQLRLPTIEGPHLLLLLLQQSPDLRCVTGRAIQTGIMTVGLESRGRRREGGRRILDPLHKLLLFI